MRSRRAFLVGLGLAALGVSSCGKTDGRKPTFPVSGKVVLGQSPVAHATVILHPVGDADPNAVKPRGTTKADGSFTLTTYDGNDGAPAGEYRVTVELWLGSAGDLGPTSRLPARYARPESSGLTAIVAAGRTELKPIEIKRW
jgi:hypothetical protein